MVVGQGVHLLERCIRQALLRKAQGRTPQTGHAFDIGLAVFVKHLHTLAAHNDQRPVSFQLPQLGVGVQMVLHVVVACYGKFGGGGVHGLTLSVWNYFKALTTASPISRVPTLVVPAL